MTPEITALMEAPAFASLHDLLEPLLRRSCVEPRLQAAVVGTADAGDGTHLPIPRFVFRGPAAGVEPVRLALFGLVHGDEPAGATAILQLLAAGVEEPTVLRGVDLFCYPICNPIGYMLGTRGMRDGVDLNRQFWRGSRLSEVQLIERELRVGQFDGLVALHADCDSPGMYAFARGPVTSDELVAPALAAAEGVLPRNTDVVIDGFSASHGVIRDCYEGVLAAPPEQSPAPFEIILETPGRASEAEQARAALSALRGIIAALPRLSLGGAGI